MAKFERSCGVVVYHAEDGLKREFLILHYPNGHWDFAKGHVEKGESETEAALRELREETGIRSLDLHEGFRHSFDYYYHRDRQRYHKEVVFFLGRARGQKVVLSHEHTGYAWLAYKEALAQITYENAKELLVRAEAYLVKAGKSGALKAWF